MVLKGRILTVIRELKGPFIGPRAGINPVGKHLGRWVWKFGTLILK